MKDAGEVFLIGDDVLDRFEAIEEDLANEVIGFVLKDAGGEVREDLAMGVAVAIEIFDFDFAIAGDEPANAWNTEAAFPVLNLLFAVAQ